MATKIELKQSYSGAGYGQLALHHGQTLLIMGNTVQTKKDGTRWIWAGDWTSGERINAPVTELEPYPEEQPTLPDVVRHVEAWARDGNADAMWWLGDFYEFGSRAIGANGGKALAYYLAAIRCQPDWYSYDTVCRILQDGSELFRAGHPADVEDRTPRDHDAFLSRFREYRALHTEQRIHLPDTSNWQECIAVTDGME